VGLVELSHRNKGAGTLQKATLNPAIATTL
jgi:hypothetical protein